MPRVHFANGSPTRVPQMTEFEEHHTPLDHDMLHISPSEYIVFSRVDGNESNVEITCASQFPVTYKIQTTSPDKFRVRPRCGVLQAGETVSVSILLKSEYQLSEGSKDKFLVMSVPAPQGGDLTPPQLAEFWKQKVSNSPDVEQHRLCCIYRGAGEPQQQRNGYGAHTGEGFDKKPSSNITDLSKHAKQLEKQLRFTQILQCVTLVFLLILSAAVVYLLKLQTGIATEATSGCGAGVSDMCKKGRHI